MSDGDVWKIHRKVLQNILRDFGFGKSSMEDKIHEECCILIDEILKTEGQPFDLHYPFAKAVSNITCSIIYGHRFEYNDDTFHTLIKRYDEGLKHIARGAVVNFFPMLRYLPGDLFNLKYIHHTDVLSTNFNKDLIEQRLRRNDRKNIETFIDAYIDAMEQLGEFPDKSEKLKIQMAKVFNDFFGAGTETTSTTLRWAVVFLLHNPEYLSRVQVEIDDIIGADQAPSMAHMRKMPLTEAFLCETLRMGNITPLGLFHETTKDVHISGCDIPAGTVVVSDMTSVLKNPGVFSDPHKFYPERFLDEEGKIVKPDSFIPFGIGKRVCLGEKLARMELFIFFTMLLRKFTFTLPDGHVLPKLDGVLGMTLTPVPYKVCVLERQGSNK